MSKEQKQLVESILDQLAERKELRDRFLASPLSVTTELAGSEVSEELLAAIGKRFRERFGSGEGTELPTEDLDAVAGGATTRKLRDLKPKLGSVLTDSPTMTWVG